MIHYKIIRTCKYKNYNNKLDFTLSAAALKFLSILISSLMLSIYPKRKDQLNPL